LSAQTTPWSVICTVAGVVEDVAPRSRILTLLGWFPISIPAWVYLGG
jgi:hypothetical protein